MQRLLLALSAAFIATGLFVGLVVSVSAADSHCGTAFRESSDARVDQLSDALVGGDGSSVCDEVRSTARTLPATLLVLGIALLAVTPLMRERDEPFASRRPRPTDSPAS